MSSQNMQCDELDLKAYALGEASAAERKAIEGHATACDECRAELESLGTLRTAMMSWAQENMNAEPPRRIAFVSDKVFEPNLWQRWFATLNPVNLLVPAALAGLVAFGVAHIGHPAQPVAIAGEVVPANTSDIATRVDNAVKAAIAESDRRHSEETLQLVRATERRMRQENSQIMAQTMAVMDSNFEVMRKHETTYMRASADIGGRQ